MKNDPITPSKIGDNRQATMALLAEASDAFRAWVDEKGVSVRDLAPLRALPATAVRHRLMQVLGDYYPNKNLGVQALEWAVDLLLSGTTEDEIFIQVSFQEWHEHLKARRYPQRYGRLQEMKSWAARVAMPKGTTMKVVERGDALEYELKVSAATPEDLARKIASLYEQFHAR